MRLAAWLASLAGEEATTSVARLARDAVVGTSTERLLARAIDNAIEASVRQLGMQNPRALGLSCSQEALTRTILSELISSIGLFCRPDGRAAALFAILQTQQLERALAGAATDAPSILARSGVGEQAARVNAWISLASEPPHVIVVNNSDAPIFDVRPTPALWAFGPRGEPSATVGHAPLGIARQVDPDSAYVWPLNHCSGWGGSGAVRGQLHVHFKDAAERGWLLAHDHLSLSHDPWG